MATRSMPFWPRPATTSGSLWPGSGLCAPFSGRLSWSGMTRAAPPPHPPEHLNGLFHRRLGWSGKVTAEPDAHPKIIDKRRVQYALMDLRPIDRQEYYNGFASRALWPTMHYRMGLSEFSRADLAGYLRVNHTFASALARLLQPDDLVWVHDYHLIPLAAELRALGATNPIGYFHHIPWPAPEVFGTLPGSRELLRAVADYDLVGVQIEQDADNLRRGLVQELG